ncbi:MAG TPA: hypothetical protein VLV78_20840 [Thermoanaerobaculia bacterium]|nr:hypothetical protein [Thermoanaerobaculia bacterium]
MKTTTRTYTQRIEASPDHVFPLLCPVREGEWLAGWRDQVEMIHSQSGLAEDGCVFRTRPRGEPETVWMITRHDPVEKIVEFVRFTAGLVVTRLSISVKPAPDRSSSVDIRYTFVPVSPAGADFVSANFPQDRFQRDMAWWEESMNHWLRTGELLTVR